MTEIPQTEDLYYDLLATLGQQDQPVAYSALDDEVIGSLGLRGQLDPEDDRRLRERLGFARSGLSLIGAANNPQRGHWITTDVGRRYLAGDPADERQRLRDDIGETYANRGVDRKFLEQARDDAEAGAPLELTVRDLLGHWQYRRRGTWVNKQIREDLGSVGLTTEPSFASAWIDGKVRVVRLPTGTGKVDVRATVDATGSAVRSEAPADTISLLVGNLESANRSVVSVTPHDPLEKARSLMVLKDFSQLAVMSGERSLKGYVSWESIARARLRDADATVVRDCTEQAQTVKPADHLLDVVPQIVKNGFVFVRGRDNSLAGIVTTADLSEQFVALANPFVLIGEIEQWLRRGLDSAFTQVELAETSDPSDTERDVTSAANLTLGETKRLIENPDNWDRLSWNADRGVFIEALERSRVIRNGLMHFGPDPVEGDDLEHLRGLRSWLRGLVVAGEGRPE